MESKQAIKNQNKFKTDLNKMKKRNPKKKIKREKVIMQNQEIRQYMKQDQTKCLLFVSIKRNY